MDSLWQAAAENWFWTVIGAMAIVWIISAMIESILKSSATERSRREIAAYIAEGSMTPEQGEKLLKAGQRSELV